MSDTSLTLDQAAEQISGILNPQTEETQAEDAATEADATETEEAEVEADPDEAEAEAETEDTQEDPAPEPQAIEIDGQKIPLEEVKRGMLRQADYTRKTQELADHRKALESEAAALRQERDLYSQLLPALQQQLQAAEPDWDNEFADNPIEAVKKQYEFQRKREAALVAQQEAQRIQSVREQETAQQYKARLDEEYGKLVAAIPEWKNADTAKAEMAKLVEVAKTFGWSDAELNGFNDHRQVLVLRAAAKGLDQQKRVAAVKAAEPKVAVMKPGAKPTRVADEVTQMKQRLAKSGRVEDAAAFIRNTILKGEK